MLAKGLNHVDPTPPFKITVDLKTAGQQFKKMQMGYCLCTVLITQVMEKSWRHCNIFVIFASRFICWYYKFDEFILIYIVLTLQNVYQVGFFSPRYVHFVQEQGLRDSQCMLFAHHKPGANAKIRSQIRKLSLDTYNINFAS